MKTSNADSTCCTKFNWLGKDVEPINIRNVNITHLTSCRKVYSIHVRLTKLICVEAASLAMQTLFHINYDAL